MEKKSSSNIVLLVLIIIALGLVGYLVFNNKSSEDNPVLDGNNNENDSQNNKVEEIKFNEEELSNKLTEMSSGFSNFSNGEISLETVVDRLVFVALILNNEATELEAYEGWNVKYVSKATFVDKYNELFGAVNNFEEDFDDKDNILFTGEQYDSINDSDIVWNSVLGGALPSYVMKMTVVSISEVDNDFIVTGFAEFDDESKKDFEIIYRKANSKIYLARYQTM